MSWTYSGDPASSQMDKIRYLIGDTNQAQPLLQNEEINFEIESEPNAYKAAANCCDTIAAKFTRDVNNKVGPLAVEAGERAKRYTELANRLRSRKTGSTFAMEQPQTHSPIFNIGLMANE